jgi:HNH endonuclease
MRSDEREALRVRFAFRCGYCGVSETDVGAELTVDHFHPRSRGGPDEIDNWIYCCHACNEFKGDYWGPESARRILHPLRDNLAEHLAERDDGTLEALTESGAFHVQKLHLNRSNLVAHRRERRQMEAALQMQESVLERLQQLEQLVEDLTARIERLGGGASTPE